nr:uncharacterized mitochondrial protein AtMg00810-like [Tanacetum cinerariifolium]
MEAVEVPRALEYKGGQLNAAHALEEVSSDENEMVEVKVLMELAEKMMLSAKKAPEMRILRVDQLTKDSSSSEQKDIIFVKSSVDDKKMPILSVERPWLSEAEGFILPNHDIGRILLAESERNTTKPLVAVTDSSVTYYDSTDESLFCSTPLPPLKKLGGAEPIFGPKTIKLILRSKSTFKAETLKGVIRNEPSSTLGKDNKSSLASKVNSTPDGPLTMKSTPLSLLMSTQGTPGVFNTKRQQTKETYHIIFDESLDAIKFSKPLVDNINIIENKRYPPDEYLYPYEPSQRYQANPKESYLIAVKRIFKYLKGTPSLGLWYSKCSGFDLKGHSDSDYAGCNMDKKSTSGACQLLRGKLVCWSAKKHQSIAMSSAKDEYVATARCYANIL